MKQINKTLLQHPGQYLKELMSGKTPEEINVKHVADSLHVSRTHMSAIFNTHSLISPLMAIKIELVYGLSAESILNYQNQYLIETARIELDKMKLDLKPIGK